MNARPCVPLALALALALASAGCGTLPGPTLQSRNTLRPALVIHSEPPGAEVYTDIGTPLGPAPAEQSWLIEELVWSDGHVSYRRVPDCTPLRPGDLLAEGAVIAIRDGSKRGKAHYSLKFEGSANSSAVTVNLQP